MKEKQKALQRGAAENSKICGADKFAKHEREAGARARALCSHQNLLGVQGEDGLAGRVAPLVTVWVLQLEN